MTDCACTGIVIYDEEKREHTHSDARRLKGCGLTVPIADACTLCVERPSLKHLGNELCEQCSDARTAAVYRQMDAM